MRKMPQTKTVLLGILALASSLLPVSGVNAQALPPYPETGASCSDRQADVKLLRRALEHLHPGLTRYAEQETIDAAWAALETASGQPMSDLAFYRAVSIACAKIRCGHTRVMAPAVEAYRKQHPTQLPFSFRIFGEQLIVDAVVKGVVGLSRGDRILRVEGQDVAGLIEQIGATVCLDGFTDSIRASRLDTAYEFADSGLDHYLPAWIGFRSEFRLVVRREGRDTPVTVPAVRLAEWRQLAPAPRNFADATNLRQLDAETAVLTVGTFVNYRKPIDATKRYRDLFRKIHATKARHLIVDLRANGGGSDDASWPLARFLIQQPIVVSQPPIVRNYRCPEDLQKHLRTWEEGVWDRPKSLFKKVPGGYELSPVVAGPLSLTPHADRFRGRITVLTSHYNASGSTMLLACLQKKAGVRLVGEKTGGAPRGPTAGLLFTLALPHSGLRVNIPAMRVRTTVESYRDGQGVVPNVEVTLSKADFLAGRDPVLAAARR